MADEDPDYEIIGRVKVPNPLHDDDDEGWYPREDLHEVKLMRELSGIKSDLEYMRVGLTILVMMVGFGLIVFLFR